MKKYIGIGIGVAAVAIVVLLVMSPKKPSFVAGGPGLDNYVPQSTVAYYSLADMQGTWKEIRDSRFYKEITSLPVWGELQAQDAIGTFLKTFKQGFGFDLTENRIMDVVGNEMAVAVLMGAPADPEPKILLLTRTGTKTQLAELVGRLLDKAKAAGQQKVETWTYGGHKLNNLKSADPTVPELNYVFMGNVLVAGVGKTRSVLESVVDLYNGKGGNAIGDSKNYQKFVSLASTVNGKKVGMFFMDFERIAKAVEGANLPIPGAMGANVGQTLSLLKLIGGVSTVNNGLFTKIFVLPNKEGMDANTRALWEAKPQALSSIRYVPKGTMLYSVTNSMDVEKLWGIWKENLATQAPEQSKVVLDAITQAETNLGMSVEGDLLSWVGDEIAYTFNDVNLESVFPIPKMSLMVKVTNKAKAQAFIEKLVNYANQQASAAPADGSPTPPAAPIQFRLDETTYNGVLMKYVNVPLMGKGLTPGFAFLDDFLVLSTSTAILEQMADISKGKGASLVDDESFASVNSKFPSKTNQMGYINTQRILDIAVDVVNWVISFQQLNLPAPGSPGGLTASQTAGATQKALRETVIPMLKAMKAIRVVGISTTYTNEGIEQIIATRLEDIVR